MASSFIPMTLKPTRVMIEAIKDRQEWDATILDLSHTFGLEFDVAQNRFMSITANRPLWSWRICRRAIMSGFHLDMVAAMLEPVP